jgi:hypothetical protein
MFIEISHDWKPETMTLTATLAYFAGLEDEFPVHTDTLTFALTDLVGPAPAVQLDHPERLRMDLYERIDTVNRHMRRLLTLKHLLDQLPSNGRMPQGAVLRMLEGAL